MGGETMIGYSGIYVNTNTTYNITNIEKATIKIDSITKKATIITKNPELYKVGLNLFPECLLDPSSLGINFKIKSYLGFVSAINGNTIQISGVPQGQPNGTFDLYGADYPTFNPSKKTKGIVEYKLVQ
jgi:hypothetical protein